MKKIVSLILLCTFVSCSSSSTKSQSGEASLDDEFAWVNNDDFAEEKSIEKPTNDFYGESKPGEVSRETMAVVPQAKIADISFESDPLGSAVSDCYRREFDNGFKKIDQLYRTNKKNPAYWNQVGSCYYLKGEKLKALIYYNKARDLDEKYAPVINNLGVLYLLEGKDQKALGAFKKASETSKFSMVPIYNLSLIYLKYYMVNDAYNFLSKLRGRLSGDLEFENAWGVANLMKGNFQEAINTYESIDNDNWKKPQIGINASIAYLRSGNKSMARKIYEEIDIDQFPELKGSYRELGGYLGDAQ